MTLDQLKMFIAVVEAKTFSKAAEKLHISQPSISVAIKNLEHELKLALFDRSQYRPKLTVEGQKIYLKAKQILSLEKELKLSAELLAQGEESQIRIVLDIVSPLPYILNLIRAYFVQERACKLELSFCVLGNGLKDVLKNEADLYIGPVFDEIENNYSFFHSHYYMIPVLSQNHVYGKLPLKEIETRMGDISRVILREGKVHDQQKNFNDLLEDDRNIYVEDYLIKKETIAAGLGWGRLPLWNIEKELMDKTLIDLREIFLHMKIKGDIFVVPKEKDRGKHLSAILKLLST